jgi:hypothetical protein
MVRLTAALAWGLLWLAAVFVRPTPAEADLVWCFVDPVLLVDGRVVHLEVAVPQGDRQSMTSSSLLVVVPLDASASGGCRRTA